MSTSEPFQNDLPQTPCSSLRPGDPVRSVYLLGDLDQKTKKNGEPFFSMQLVDKTGSVGAVMWEGFAPIIEGNIRREDYVLIEGSASEFSGSVQITVKRIGRVGEEAVNPEDFIATGPFTREELDRQLGDWIAQVEEKDCRRLLDLMFGHERLREKFLAAPAALRIHQAYIGGLAEHTFNVLNNAIRLGEGYKPYNRDLLITATLLHDIGKIREFEWRRTIAYSDEGKLLGHIAIGSMMVENAIHQLKREPEGFSESWRQHILHLILSHHGKMEYGAPVVPKTREALLLHYGDYTDAYLSSYVEVAHEAQNRGELWTGYQKRFESALYASGPTPAPRPEPADIESETTDAAPPAPDPT